MDLYLLLGVERAATLDEIRRAYKRLARKYHPDINPGDRMAAQHFRQIADAYATLSDPGRRTQYDTTGATTASPEHATFGFEGFDFSVSVSGSSASTFGDLFADVLQQHADPSALRGAERGSDLHHTISLTFEEAMAGGVRHIRLTRQERCRTCGGTGQTRAVETRCQHCHGAGTVKSARGHMVFSKTCTYCGGAGRQGSLRCAACGGRQVEMRADTLHVPVPAGVAHDDRIRIPGKGHAGSSGGEYGDVLLTVAVEPHAVFRREGDDLHLVVPIAIHEAALGAKIDVPAIDGQPARVRIPPGTRSGQRFRVRERGVASARAARRGDLVVEVTVVPPTFLDERSKDLLREFGRIHTEDPRAAIKAACR
jgi:molecular chaperone DnaJ